MTLDETISAGQTGHLTDHQAIATAVNDFGGTLDDLTADLTEMTAGTFTPVVVGLDTEASATSSAAIKISGRTFTQPVALPTGMHILQTSGTLTVKDEDDNTIAAVGGIVTIPGARRGVPPAVFDASTYSTMGDAVAAVNAYGEDCVLWMPPKVGPYTTAVHLLVGDNVALWAQDSALICTTAGAGLQFQAPRKFYHGLLVNGNDTAVGGDSIGDGISGLLQFGTEHDSNPPGPHVFGFGEGGLIHVSDMQVKSVGAGGTGCAFHNLQNSEIKGLRVNDSIIATRALLIDNGCKNLYFNGTYPTVCGIGVEINTSKGPQRTGKIYFNGGLVEEVLTGFKIMDCEQVGIRDFNINAQPSAVAAVHCLAGGDRDTNGDGTGNGTHGPAQLEVETIVIGGSITDQFANGLRLDTAVAVQVGGWVTSSFSDALYKVENAAARITEVRPHHNEAVGTRYVSVGGFAEQTTVRRFTSPRSILMSPGGTWTDAPAALTELFGSVASRVWLDASRYTHARISVTVVTGSGVGSGHKLRLYYKTSAGGTFATDYLTAGTSDIEVAITNAATVKSSWVPLATGAKADVIFSIGGVGGNGTADPVLGNIVLELY